MNRPGGPAAGMIPVGNGQFTSTHSRVASHSAFIPPSSANNGCSRLLTASCRLSLARGCARDASHVRSSTPIYGNGTSPTTLPEPDASAATTSSAPPNVARMACSDVAWPALTERMRGAGPRPRSILSQLTFLHGAALARGKDEARCLAAAERDSQAGSHCLSVWSPLARGVRNAKHCCSRPIPEGPPGWGITRRPDRSAAERTSGDEFRALPTGQILQRPMRRIQSRLDTWWPQQSHACHPAASPPRSRPPLARPTTTALSPRRTGGLPSAGGFCELVKILCLDPPPFSRIS